MAEAVVVAFVGAESTGKTALAQALAQRLAREHGLRATWVPEWLRPWCDEHGRTPRRHEQAEIAAAQTALIDQAACTHDIVFADTTALMTAVYSHIVFGDDSLDAMAVAAHRRCGLTLLTGLDMPWEPDGLQREGPHVRPPVDARLRTLLHAHGFAYSVILGQGAQREQAALQALAFARPGLSALRGAASPVPARQRATAANGLPAAGCAAA
ncbi:MAG TPA: ATP-binding protein [Rubrivivax sp.]|nr:ATP-binding protein [Burkholderiales bacterium]HNT39919.1 ATP-binding protein [Rubrivivax sp.]